MSMRRAFLWRMASAAIVGSLAGALPAFAQSTPVAAERLGLKGYDPVAYFTLGTATPGVATYELVWTACATASPMPSTARCSGPIPRSTRRSSAASAP